MIVIIESELRTDEPVVWACELEITQSTTTYRLPATAPETLLKSELQAYFEGIESYLWTLAQEKQYPPDVFRYGLTWRILKAFALVVLDEINILRAELGLAPRSASQIVDAIKAKLQAM